MPPAGSGGDIAQALTFYGFAAITVIAALLVVSIRNIFHAVLFLVVTFVGVAALYLTLSAAFLAMIQVLIYVGAIAVLTLFAVFLTRNAMTQGNPPGRFQLSAFATSILVFLTLTIAAQNSVWASGPSTDTNFSPENLAQALFTTYAFPFELASVLLLVAMIGAIVIAKE